MPAPMNRCEPLPSSDTAATALARRMHALLRSWRAQGHPTREQLLAGAEEIALWRAASGCAGLWLEAPLLATATLDDLWGQGLAVIERLAEAAGMRVLPLGTDQEPEAILAACRQHQPAWLGLTTIWAESEPRLAAVVAGLPPATRLIAGGPAFQADAELAARAGVKTVLRDGAAFWELLLAERVQAGGL